MPNGLAIPQAVQEKGTTIVAAYGTGVLEALSYRWNPAFGTVISFGGAIVGIAGSLMTRGLLAEAFEGMAASSAGSLGHMSVQALVGRKALVGGSNGRAALGRNPRELVGAKSGNPGNPGNPRQEIMNEELLV